MANFSGNSVVGKPQHPTVANLRGAGNGKPGGSSSARGAAQHEHGGWLALQQSSNAVAPSPPTVNRPTVHVTTTEVPRAPVSGRRISGFDAITIKNKEVAAKRREERAAEEKKKKLQELKKKKREEEDKQVREKLKSLFGPDPDEATEKPVTAAAATKKTVTDENGEPMMDDMFVAELLAAGLKVDDEAVGRKFDRRAVMGKAPEAVKYHKQAATKVQVAEVFDGNQFIDPVEEDKEGARVTKASTTKQLPLPTGKLFYQTGMTTTQPKPNTAASTPAKGQQAVAKPPAEAEKENFKRPSIKLNLKDKGKAAAVKDVVGEPERPEEIINQAQVSPVTTPKASRPDKGKRKRPAGDDVSAEPEHGGEVKRTKMTDETAPIATKPDIPTPPSVKGAATSPEMIIKAGNAQPMGDKEAAAGEPKIEQPQIDEPQVEQSKVDSKVEQAATHQVSMLAAPSAAITSSVDAVGQGAAKHLQVSPVPVSEAATVVTNNDAKAESVPSVAEKLECTVEQSTAEQSPTSHVAGPVVAAAITTNDVSAELVPSVPEKQVKKISLEDYSKRKGEKSAATAQTTPSTTAEASRPPAQSDVLAEEPGTHRADLTANEENRDDAQDSSFQEERIDPATALAKAQERRRQMEAENLRKAQEAKKQLEKFKNTCFPPSLQGASRRSFQSMKHGTTSTAPSSVKGGHVQEKAASQPNEVGNGVSTNDRVNDGHSPTDTKENTESNAGEQVISSASGRKRGRSIDDDGKDTKEKRVRSSEVELISGVAFVKEDSESTSITPATSQVTAEIGTPKTAITASVTSAGKKRSRGVDDDGCAAKDKRVRTSEGEQNGINVAAAEQINESAGTNPSSPHATKDVSAAAPTAHSPEFRNEPRKILKLKVNKLASLAANGAGEQEMTEKEGKGTTHDDGESSDGKQTPPGSKRTRKDSKVAETMSPINDVTSVIDKAPNSPAQNVDTPTPSTTSEGEQKKLATSKRKRGANNDDDENSEDAAQTPLDLKKVKKVKKSAALAKSGEERRNARRSSQY